ncbi:MAG: SET domain-containing protein-lysine N-methyltransferase [Chitinophagales bacterium]|nr:SET domain-containing protein-lysine N-methyltransferase [Chitinophagales bacterium]
MEIFKIASKINKKIKKKWKVDKSKISGKGIFLKDNVKKDEEIGLGFIKIKNTGNLDKDYKREILGKYLNHSKKPNTKLKIINNEFYIVSIKNIDSGEELFIDYDKFPWEGKKEEDF